MITFLKSLFSTSLHTQVCVFRNWSLLCLKISVPTYCIDLLKGFDKNNKVFTGYINFSQIIVNFDYELQ